MATIEINGLSFTPEEKAALNKIISNALEAKSINQKKEKRKKITITFSEDDNESQEPPMQEVYHRLKVIYIILNDVSIFAAIGAGLGAIWGVFAGSLLFPTVCTLIGAVVGLLISLFNMKRSQNQMPLKPSND